MKKLRYYARFIVVCLLLNNLAYVKKLSEELSYYIEDYIKVHKAADSSEWQLILEEINKFTEVLFVL